MRKFVTVFYFFLLFITCYSFTAVGTAAEAETDLVKMHQDLDLLKAVLDKSLEQEIGSGNTARLWLNFGTQAVYINGYGVLFTYQCQYLPLLPKPGDTAENPKKSAVKKNEKIRQILVDFLGNYGSALEQLPAEEYISVIIQPQENPLRHVIRDMDISMEASRFDQTMVTVAKKTVDLFSSKKLSQDEFAAQIQRHNTNISSELNSEVEIMNKIFDTALRNNKKCQISLHGSTWGEYIPNFGVLFMLNAAKGLKVEKFRFTGEAFGNSDMDAPQNPNAQLEKTTNFQQIKAVLIQLLADYGHTLRHIKPGEWVGINIKLRNFDTPDNSMFLKVKSVDIHNFHQNQISMKTLIEKVIISEY